MPKYSFIIPVYKVRDYIDECVQSLLNQTVTDFEIVLVDDCSPDESGKACDLWAEKDQRIKVVHHQKNEGVSAARNSGIAAADGEYILFVDGDDTVAPDLLERIYDLEADALFYSCKPDYFKQGEKIKTLTLNTQRSRYEFTAEMLAAKLREVWRLRFKKSIIDRFSIKYDTNFKMGEDWVFMCCYFAFCQSALLLNYNGYNYRIREGSAMTATRDDDSGFDGMNVLMRSVYDFLTEKGVDTADFYYLHFKCMADSLDFRWFYTFSDVKKNIGYVKVTSWKETYISTIDTFYKKEKFVYDSLEDKKLQIQKKYLYRYAYDGNKVKLYIKFFFLQIKFNLQRLLRKIFK